MTVSQEPALAVAVERSVRATPGVATLFRAGSFASNVLAASARIIGIRDDSEPLVCLEQTAEGLRVHIAIGVHHHVGALETIRRVETGARAVIDTQHRGSAEIRITVVHISDTSR